MADPRRESVKTAYIDDAEMTAILTDPLKFLVAVDGSELSMQGFELVCEVFMAAERESTITTMHVYDDAKTYLPPKWRQDAIKAHCDAKLTSSYVTRRYNMVWVPRNQGGGTSRSPAGQLLAEEANRCEADFVVVGYFGRKGAKKKADAIASNTLYCMQRCFGSVVIMQQEEGMEKLKSRPAKFIVSVSLNLAATKAVLDAVRLAKSGDEIHVIYVKALMEKTESDYTIAMREKYESFFAGLKDSSMASCASGKFADRNVQFKLLDKTYGRTTPQCVADYAELVGGDFIVVGTNTMRQTKGKPHLGSVSLQILHETSCNFVVANYKPEKG